MFLLGLALVSFGIGLPTAVATSGSHEAVLGKRDGVAQNPIAKAVPYTLENEMGCIAATAALQNPGREVSKDLIDKVSYEASLKTGCTGNAEAFRNAKEKVVLGPDANRALCSYARQRYEIFKNNGIVNHASVRWLELSVKCGPGS